MGLLQGHNVLAGLLLGMTEIASRNDLNAREHGFAFNMFGCRFEFANEQHAGGQDISSYHTNRQAVELIRDLSVQLTRRSEGYKEFTALMMFQGSVNIKAMVIFDLDVLHSIYPQDLTIYMHGSDIFENGLACTISWSNDEGKRGSFNW